MKRLKRIQEVEIAHCLEGLRYALMSVAISHSRLQNDVRELEQKLSGRVSIQEAVEVLDHCWRVIDGVYRANELVKALGSFGVALKDKRNKEFSRAVQQAATLRNYYHHLQSRLRKGGDLRHPTMGSLSWLCGKDKNKCFMLVLSSGAMEISSPGLVYDRKQREFVSDFQFVVADKSAFIGDLVRGCANLSEVVEDFLCQNNVHEDEGISPMLIATRFDIKAVEQRNASKDKGMQRRICFRPKPDELF